MRNYLIYYYDIYCDDIIKNNKNYKIFIRSSLYYLVRYEGDISLLNNIYEYLVNHNIYCHEIILNKQKTFVTNIEGNSYILIRIHYKINKINYLDIINYNILFGKNKCNWKELWINKIDYYEYQMNQFRKKYSLLNSSFKYYSGMTETAIMLVGMVDKKLYDTYIEHNRIYKNSSSLDFFNPLNMIIDVKVRDIAEYFKQQFFYFDNPIISVKNYIDYEKLSNEEAILFFARILYPSYYFDIYDEIVQDKSKENKINMILDKTNTYENFIEEVYAYLKAIYNIPEIEWLIKT